MTQTVLDKIKAYKLEEVAADKAATPLSVIEDRARGVAHTWFCHVLDCGGQNWLWPDRRGQESITLQGIDPTRF